MDENGAVTGIEEALKVLQTTKPFLFTAKPTGQKINVGKKIDPSGQDDIDGVEAAFLRKNPGLKI